ncbi:hypothetical protein G6F57_014536 [Rhizopus arrhizus]|nr:hypothetical protein G6F57_014536 [Rhizopus arrhizus]
MRVGAVVHLIGVEQGARLRQIAHADHRSREPAAVGRCRQAGRDADARIALFERGGAQEVDAQAAAPHLQAAVGQFAAGARPEHALIAGAKRGRVRVDGDQRFDASRAVGVFLPFRPEDEVARQVAAGE